MSKVIRIVMMDGIDIYSEPVHVHVPDEVLDMKDTDYVRRALIVKELEDGLREVVASASEKFNAKYKKSGGFKI